MCALVDGLYQIEVTVFGYDNPTGRCQECLEEGVRGCCDNFESTSCSGSSLCDSFFIYCLRAVGSTGRGCSYFGNRISNVNVDDGSLNFSQSTVLGLENPTVLQGLTDTYTVYILLSPAEFIHETHCLNTIFNSWYTSNGLLALHNCRHQIVSISTHSVLLALTFPIALLGSPASH